MPIWARISRQGQLGDQADDGDVSLHNTEGLLSPLRLMPLTKTL